MTQLALVIDLNVCVGCHACVTSCKEWNTSGTAGPMSDMNPYGKDPTGTPISRPSASASAMWVSRRTAAMTAAWKSGCGLWLAPTV